MNTEILIRFVAFSGVLLLMASWERLAPCRRLTTSKLRRWAANLGVVALNTIVVRLVFGTGVVGTAMFVTGHGWGLLNRVSWSPWFEAILAVVVLDFILYLQHVMLHAVPVFWRFHMMHHADLDCDVTTGVRFHPVEVAISMVIKSGAIIVIGASPAAVLTFEVLLNATSMFNHSNAQMPAAVDRVLRWFLVTPDMHRIHHSILPQETNRNFGFNLPWWDRLLGTYCATPEGGHKGMTLGLEQFRNSAHLTLTGILLLPFFGKPGRYPLGRR